MVALTGVDPLLCDLCGLEFGTLRGDRPVDGRRPGEPDDDRLESDNVAGARVPGRWHQVRIVRMIDGSAMRLERDAPRRCPADAVVHLARVRAEHVDRHQPDVQRMVRPLFENVGSHRHHPVGTPPGDERPRPTDRVTVQHGGIVERNDHGRAHLTDNVGGSWVRVCVWARRWARAQRVQVEVEEHKKTKNNTDQRREKTHANIEW